MNLLFEIEDVIDNNGSDFELSKLFKRYIHEYKESLPFLFEKNQGKDFLVLHTKKLDSIMSLMYKTVLRRLFGDYLPMRSSVPIAIVALGSYGREQLCVHSDIDLLIVYEDVEGYNTTLIIEKLFYLALDAGLKLGHRVHETSDLFRAANEDLTIRTSLMESRLIIGSPFTWQETQRQLTRIRLHEQKEFLIAKVQEAQMRRKKYPVSMEPNIKESVGGLRDTQLLFWIAHTIYGVNNIKDLVGTVFNEESYKEFRVALELMYRVRSALHLITNKQEDTLRLEYIPSVAKMLGFNNQIKLATKVIAAGWRIDNFTRIFTKKMIRPYLYDVKMLSQLRHSRISKGLYEFKGRVYISYNQKINDNTQLLELLFSLEDKDYKFDSGVLSCLTYTKISHPLNKHTYSLLQKLLQRKHTYCFLELFYDAGILHELFGNFRKVRHMPQFDGYHHYPVDIHSVECVKALENIKEPFIQSLHDALSEDEKLIVKIATLFHDTGKGRKQDHSEVGAKLILPFLRQLKMSQEMQDRAVVLVKHHILMSSVAFKENIYNEKTLYKFMSKVGDVKNLNMLYVLTYADINGVGGGTYNSFNSKLLGDLYKSALEVAQNRHRITDAKKRLIIEKRVQNLLAFKQLPRTLQKKILHIESNLFFFKRSPQNIIEVAQKARETQEYSFTLKNRDSLTIEIYRKIPLNLGFLLASLSHISVASMEIFTLFDDIKYFKIEFIQKVDEGELSLVEDKIDAAFDMSKETKFRDVVIKREEISIDFEHSLTHAEILIHTKNQKGLLAYVMHCFDTLNINIVTAKIHSSKYKVRDSFLMDKSSDICNNAELIYEMLTK
ncbi:HD domain-containing protein [Sulfurimonas sp. SAG-AH-194-L11]|nr:HD domain-containing protein [Sulfurimonas sp. SAG-AH-194-L11]MDF1877278.1 HD domain-containing protein [Sulfurimonas sp. SAG-AH-194-L11]